MYFLFFVSKFFKNLAYASICCIAFERGILFSNCSLSFLGGTRGYERIFSILSSFLFTIFSSSFLFSIFLFLSSFSPLSFSSSLFFLSFFIHIPISHCNALSVLPLYWWSNSSQISLLLSSPIDLVEFSDYKVKLMYSCDLKETLA